MQCPIEEANNREVLLDYCAQRLEPGKAALLERHIDLCPQCGRFVRAQQQVWEALEIWQPEPVSDAFDTRLYSRVQESEDRRSSRLPGGWTRWKPALPFAVACASTMVALLLAPPPAKGPVPQLPVPQMQERT